MDTTTLGANYGNEYLFLTGIIIIIAFIIIYFLLKSKKDNTPTEDVVNVNPENTSKSEKHITKEPSTTNQPPNSSSEKRPIIIPSPILQEVNVKIEEESKHSLPKYIGYEPINIFTQTEPLHYPYVVMPSRTKCPIKIPQKGRSGRKGYKEDEFLLYIRRYFKETFNIYDDRYVLTKANRYEPDFSLLNEKDGINIFLDIEIDEPYEGINDVNIRKATHFQLADINRNNEFKNRGWIVIRFAEIQIHQNPNGCCRFIADVIKSICPQFTIPHDLLSIKRIEPVQQWTKDIALAWSKQRYREKYLGIDHFGYIPKMIGPDITIIQDEKVEEEVVDDKIVVIPDKTISDMPEQNIVSTAIKTGKYIPFQYDQEKTIVKPSNLDGRVMTDYCNVKNSKNNAEVKNAEKVAKRNSKVENVTKGGKNTVDKSASKQLVMDHFANGVAKECGTIPVCSGQTLHFTGETAPQKGSGDVPDWLSLETAEGYHIGLRQIARNGNGISFADGINDVPSKVCAFIDACPIELTVHDVKKVESSSRNGKNSYYIFNPVTIK